MTGTVVNRPRLGFWLYLSIPSVRLSAWRETRAAYHQPQLRRNEKRPAASQRGSWRKLLINGMTSVAMQPSEAVMCVM